MLELLVILYMTFIGMGISLLFICSRFSKHKTIFMFFITTILMIISLIILWNILGTNYLIKIYTLVIHIPAILICTYISRYRGWKLLFQILSAVSFCMMIQHIAGLTYYLTNENILALMVSYIISTITIFLFIIYYIKPILIEVLLYLNHGWFFMCLVMATYYITVIYLIPTYAGVELNSTILKPVISLIMIGFYTLIMFLFTSTLREIEIKNNLNILEIQTSALQSRINTIKTTEKMIQMERHDLRHRLKTLENLIINKKYDVAIEFINSSQERIDKCDTVSWCKPPVLDAVFSSYFEEAKLNNINIDAKIILSQELNINESELAIVIANVLENAIHACLKLPIKQRKIKCKVIEKPTIMLEILNTCCENVNFDDNSLPISNKNGHGIGVQSIISFCNKYNAIYKFECKNGWFSVQIIM